MNNYMSVYIICNRIFSIVKQYIPKSLYDDLYQRFSDFRKIADCYMIKSLFTNICEKYNITSVLSKEQIITLLSNDNKMKLYFEMIPEYEYDTLLIYINEIIFILL